MSMDYTTRVKDTNGQLSLLEVSNLEIEGIFPVNGGKLMVKRLEHIPLLDCTFDNCDDFAEHLMVLVCYSGEDSISYCCDKHRDFVIQLGKDNIPVEIMH